MIEKLSSGQPKRRLPVVGPNLYVEGRGPQTLDVLQVVFPIADPFGCVRP